MRCIICNSNCQYYFSKVYDQQPIADLMRDIGPVDYYKCENCGFVLSKTHSELEESSWAALNESYHHFNEGLGIMVGNQPPYAEQAMMIQVLGHNKIIDSSDLLDYAAGYGVLKKLLSKYFGQDILVYDRYVTATETSAYVEEHDLRKYKTVANSAMFEHVLSREDLNSVNDLVAEDGCLIIHTVVCENIPKDPNWFYLEPPVHTAFHTNKSMQALMKQWGYTSSIYCVPSKCWVLFKQAAEDLEERVDALNEELQSDWFFYKNGFVDYWKGF